MNFTANCLVVLVASLHIYFLVLEMFLWDRPYGRRTFGHTSEAAKHTKTLAMNQGLYNGFLAAGLFWGLTQGPGGSATTTFFLICVIIAGVFGGLTASKKIIIFQAIPAVVALFFVLFSS